MSVSTHEHLRFATGQFLTGEHDRFRHYVLAHELREAIRWQIPVEALCGKRWRPDGDPTRYPMCPTCAASADVDDTEE